MIGNKNFSRVSGELTINFSRVSENFLHVVLEILEMSQIFLKSFL